MGGESFTILADFLFLRFPIENLNLPSVSSCGEYKHIHIHVHCILLYIIYNIYMIVLLENAEFIPIVRILLMLMECIFMYIYMNKKGRHVHPKHKRFK